MLKITIKLKFAKEKIYLAWLSLLKHLRTKLGASTECITIQVFKELIHNATTQSFKVAKFIVLKQSWDSYFGKVTSY